MTALRYTANAFTKPAGSGVLECGASAPLSFSLTLRRPEVVRTLDASGKEKAVLKPRTPKRRAAARDAWEPDTGGLYN
jgi:hypothetical protein